MSTIERFEFAFRALSRLRLTFDFSSILISRRRLIRQLDKCSTSRRHPTSKMSTYLDLSDLPMCLRRTSPSFKMCRLHLKATLEFEPFYRGGGRCVRWMSRRDVHARCFKRRPTPTIERFDFGFRALSRLTFDFSSILISRRRFIFDLFSAPS